MGPDVVICVQETPAFVDLYTLPELSIIMPLFESLNETSPLTSALPKSDIGVV